MDGCKVSILIEELTNLPIRHQSPIHRILNHTDLILPVNRMIEVIEPYPDPPWVEPRWTIENMGKKRELVKEQIINQVEEEKIKNACVVFTDGSFIPNRGGGAAMVMEEVIAAHAYGPADGISNCEMESMAIMTALTHFKRLTDINRNRYESLAIFSDSQAALELFSNPMKPKTLQYLARFLRRSYQKIPNNFNISLYWTPGHKNIEMNEKADQEAKAKAEDQSNTMMLLMSLGSLLQHTRKLFNKREAVSKTPLKTKGKWIADGLNQLEKGQAAAIFQLRCGHCPLRKFLNRIGAEESKTCDTCKAVETPAHFLIYCRKYTKQRREF